MLSVIHVEASVYLDNLHLEAGSLLQLGIVKHCRRVNVVQFVQVKLDLLSNYAFSQK